MQRQQAHNFRRSLAPTSAPRVRRRFFMLYQHLYPDLARVEWYDDDMNLQRSGIDAAVIFPEGGAETFDEKIRNVDYGDMLIEVFSDKRRDVLGWALDETKTNDFIAYAILQGNVAYVLPMRKLRRAANRYMKDWIEVDRRYPHVAHNRGEDGRTWETWNVAVSWRWLTRCMGVELSRIRYPW